MTTTKTLSERIKDAGQQASATAHKALSLAMDTFREAVLISDEILDKKYSIVTNWDNPFDNMEDRQRGSTNQQENLISHIHRTVGRCDGVENKNEYLCLGFFPHGQSAVFEAHWLNIRPTLTGVEVRFSLNKEVIHLAYNAWEPEIKEGSRRNLRSLLEKGLEDTIESQLSIETITALAFRRFKKHIVDYIDVSEDRVKNTQPDPPTIGYVPVSRKTNNSYE